MALPPSSPPPKAPANPLAQRDAAQQDVFLREVDDALREDEMRGFMQRYGKPLMILVAAGLLAYAGYLWWSGEQQQQAGEHGEKLVMAIDSIEAGNLTAADKQLAPLAADGSDGSAAAAKLMRAGIAIEQNRTAEASRLLAEVAADDSAPQPYRDLATVRDVAANFDTLPPQTVVDRLKPLAVPGNAWFGPAGELVGMAYLKQGKADLAGPLFAKIARDKDAPESLRSRTRQLAGLLGTDAIDDPEKIAGSGDGEAPPAANAAAE